MEIIMNNKTFPNYSVYSGKIEKVEGESALIRIEEDDFAGTIFSFLDIQLNEDLLSYNINFVSLKYKNKEYLENASESDDFSSLLGSNNTIKFYETVSNPILLDLIEQLAKYDLEGLLNGTKKTD
jgi:hypothetical protein